MAAGTPLERPARLPRQLGCRPGQAPFGWSARGAPPSRRRTRGREHLSRWRLRRRRSSPGPTRHAWRLSGEASRLSPESRLPPESCHPRISRPVRGRWPAGQRPRRSVQCAARQRGTARSACGPGQPTCQPRLAAGAPGQCPAAGPQPYRWPTGRWLTRRLLTAGWQPIVVRQPTARRPAVRLAWLQPAAHGAAGPRLSGRCPKLQLRHPALQGRCRAPQRLCQPNPWTRQDLVCQPIHQPALCCFARSRAFGRSLRSGSRAQPAPSGRSAPRGSCSYALTDAAAIVASSASRRVAITCPSAASRSSDRVASAVMLASSRPSAAISLPSGP
jgi:hypothetical protein